MCGFSEDIYDYTFVSQGKTTIPGVDDAEEMGICDVRTKEKKENCFSSKSFKDFD